MKIIKRGIIKEDIPKEISCWNCESELEYNSSDIKSERNEQYVVCPVCHAFITV